MANYLRLNEGITLSQTITIMSIVFLVLFMLIAVPFYNSCRQKQAVSKLRQVYSILMQTDIQYALADEDPDENLTLQAYVDKYYTPYLPVKDSCVESQEKCWNEIQYVDLKNRKLKKMFDYSLVLANHAVIGFGQNKNNLRYAIVDLDGKAGKNKLGRDVFVFYLYNKKVVDDLCLENKTSEKDIVKGLHFGGWDRCGMPHDTYGYLELYDKNMVDGCNKKSMSNYSGLGVGAGCTAIVKLLEWSIDKIYPW